MPLDVLTPGKAGVRTRARLGLSHELSLVGRPLVHLQHVAQVLHRLLGRLVEAQPSVRVRGHHALSATVHFD